MPKVNSIQTSFHGGEFSPMLYGQVHADRFKTGLQVCLNYYPTLQGPLIRRPGTKYVLNVKDSANPPALIPFIFSQTQSYALEFGDKYIRFFADNGQIIAASNVFKVTGQLIFNGAGLGLTVYNSLSDSPYGNNQETVSASSVLAAGSVLELPSPYAIADVPHIRYAQQNDTLYLTHPSYPTHKLQRFTNYNWKIKPVLFQDGPYLPLNSYKTIGDNVRWGLQPQSGIGGALIPSPHYNVYGTGNNGAGAIRITTGSNHQFVVGDKVYIRGVTGTVEANNQTSSIQASYWVATAVGANTVDLGGSTFVNAATNSTGNIFPALFEMNTAPIAGSSPVWSDATLNVVRNIALVGSDGFRHWGYITAVTSPADAVCAIYDQAGLPDASSCKYWYLGVYSKNNGFPRSTCFHQDRLGLAGTPSFPQQIDASQSGSYEQFAASGSSLQVSDNNALQFRLLSDQSNPVMWLKSAAQGLLAGSLAAEWSIQPNTQAAALTPTNVNAIATSYFGSADVDAVQAGNATLYVQRALRKIREMNFFFQVGTFRSTDLTEIAEHITIPTVVKLAVQKETIPLVWGLRSDGNLLSMAYSRDDQTLKAGWSRHRLGGQSDSAGTNPIVKSFCTIPATANSSNYDQVWMIVQRSTLSGSTYTSVEYTTQPYDDSFLQEDAFQGDCGATYDSPVSVTAISHSGSSRVLAAGHGLADGDQLQLTKIVGFNINSSDSIGNLTVINMLNEQSFIASDTTIAGFNLKDFQGNYINTLSSSIYVSGGQVRKMVKTITGLNWLNGETVGILTDGGIHRDLVVASGSITLDYRAAKVQIGYRFNSDGQSLRQDGGSAQGTAIGETSRMHRVAVQYHNVGEFQMGASFTDLMTLQLQQVDVQQADQRMPLQTGISRDSVGATYDFDGWVCWRQNSMLPGMIQSLTYFSEVQDV